MAELGGSDGQVVELHGSALRLDMCITNLPCKTPQKTNDVFKHELYNKPDIKTIQNGMRGEQSPGTEEQPVSTEEAVPEEYAELEDALPDWERVGLDRERGAPVRRGRARSASHSATEGFPRSVLRREPPWSSDAGAYPLCCCVLGQ